MNVQRLKDDNGVSQFDNLAVLDVFEHLNGSMKLWMKQDYHKAISLTTTNSDGHAEKEIIPVDTLVRRVHGSFVEESSP